MAPFPGPGGKRQVATGGATGAAWTQDGQRFLFAVGPDDEQEQPLTLVTNWPAGLNR